MSLEEDALLLAKVELFANVAPRRLKLLALASSRVLFAPARISASRATKAMRPSS